MSINRAAVFYNNASFSDVTLELKEKVDETKKKRKTTKQGPTVKQIAVSKLKLAEASPRFQNMFSNWEEGKKEKIEFLFDNSVEMGLFEMLIKGIYGIDFELPNNFDDTLALILMANEYEIKESRNICHKIEKGLTPALARKYFDALSRLDIGGSVEELYDHCITLIVTENIDWRRTQFDGIYKLPFIIMKVLLKGELIRSVSEDLIFEVLIEWLDRNTVSKSSARELISLIHYPRLSSCYILSRLIPSKKLLDLMTDYSSWLRWLSIFASRDTKEYGRDALDDNEFFVDGLTIDKSSQYSGRQTAKYSPSYKWEQEICVFAPAKTGHHIQAIKLLDLFTFRFYIDCSEEVKPFYYVEIQCKELFVKDILIDFALKCVPCNEVVRAQVSLHFLNLLMVVKEFTRDWVLNETCCIEFGGDHEDDPNGEGMLAVTVTVRYM